MSDKHDDFLMNNDDCEFECSKNCEKVVHQKAKITLPVEIEPFVITGNIKTKCCGSPKIIEEHCGCKDGCQFLITQEICVSIPVRFGAVTETKEVCIECEEPVVDDSDCD
jgi:hypothetical protein